MSPTVVFWDVGEFCASAYALQVPHPPGAPLFLLLGRIFSMISFAQDIPVRIHTISAISSALTCSLLYLIIVSVIVMWKGIPSTMQDKLLIYCSAIIGALSLAFCSTFWFNAVEAEVYGLSMAFVSTIIFLGIKWYEKEENNDQLILFIAYLIGLSIGVHLLSILTLFPLMLLWYFRHNERFELKSFMLFGITSIVIFFLVYPGIVKYLPSMLDGRIGTKKDEIIKFIPFTVMFVCVYGIYYAVKEKRRVLFIGLTSFLLIILGYSTYYTVYIRANAHPPMNENDPSTIERLVSYLNREQYGDAPIIYPRRWDPDPVKRYYHNQYSSELDYMWRYQIAHMYLRYLGWNYIGIKNDLRDAGVNWGQFYLIPFLLGIIGAFYQWRKQTHFGFIMTVAFIIMGVVLALYQNQQQPQPRERDYFYVGSFFIFSLWIAYGVVAVSEFLTSLIKKPSLYPTIIYGTLVFAFLFVPVNMFKKNFHRADRSGNYVAWDYSYNLLQSCEKDAILVTNGDNDTFPVWYLQDVEGIRRDIRVVNLSLANANWYIKQLKNEEPYGAKKVPISIEDIDIENIGPVEFSTSIIEIPVSPKIVQQYLSHKELLDTSIINSGVLRLPLSPGLEYGNRKFLRVQDIVMLNIIRNSQFERPIYFAITVSDDGKLGLQNYMQLCGLAFKLVPVKSQAYWMNLDEKAMEKNLFTDSVKPSKEPQYGFLWRGLRDSTVYYDEDTRKLITGNYRNAFIAYALYKANIKREIQQVTRILDRMEELIPRKVVEMDYRLQYDVATFYFYSGNKDRFYEYANEVIEQAKKSIKANPKQQLSQYNPYIILFYTYETMGMYTEAESVLSDIKSAYAGERGINGLVEQLRAQLKATENQRKSKELTQKEQKK